MEHRASHTLTDGQPGGAQEEGVLPTSHPALLRTPPTQAPCTHSRPGSLMSSRHVQERSLHNAKACLASGGDVPTIPDGAPFHCYEAPCVRFPAAPRPRPGSSSQTLPGPRNPGRNPGGDQLCPQSLRHQSQSGNKLLFAWAVSLSSLHPQGSVSLL